MSHRNMKDELTCPICMELFRQPRRLPCGHSYCYVCLKAMLDRCTESGSGLYLHYSRSLVCPECREEVHIDSDRGVEMIPSDFKLSKLVDLFKFMKKSDSSDSSCDELQPGMPAAAAATVPSSTHDSFGPATLASATDETSLSATLLPASSDSSSLHTGRFLASLTPAGQSVCPLQRVSPSGTPAGTATPAISAHDQPRSSQPTVVSPSVNSATQPSPFIHNPPDADCSSRLATAVDIRPTVYPADTHNSETDASSGTRFNNLLLTPVVSNSETPLSATAMAHSTVSSQSHFLVGQPVSSRLLAGEAPYITDGVSVVHGRSSPQVSSSLSEQGAAAEVVEASATGSSVMAEPAVDSLEILSNWVNENHYYSQSSRNLSHSAVSLPDEVVLQEGEENPPELNSLSSVVDRVARAQSVPTETVEWNRTPQPGGSGEGVVSRSLRNAKARRVRRGVFSRFVDSGSSSDMSSSNDGDRQNQPSPQKPKRWVMTRFLRSVILSDSSSTDNSSDENDDDDVVTRNARGTKRYTNSLHLQQNSLSTAHLQSSLQNGAPSAGPEVYHQRMPDADRSPGSQATLGYEHDDSRQSPVTAQLQNLSTSCHRRSTQVTEQPETLQTSVDSNTLTKELVQDTQAGLFCVETQAKTTYNCQSSHDHQGNAHPPFSAPAFGNTEPQSWECVGPSITTATHSPVRVSSSRRHKHRHQHRHDLSSSGSPPTFYDNLRVVNERGNERTLYENIQTHCVSRGAEGSNPDLVRDLRSNPHSRHQSFVLTSEDSAGRTLYDNMDGPGARSEHTPARPRHMYPPHRNTTTDIEDLKTGYEQFPVETKSSGRTGVTESDAGLHQVSANTRLREIEDNSEYVSMTLQMAPFESEHQDSCNYYFSTGSLCHTQPHPASTQHELVDSRDHPSCYDNISSSHHPLNSLAAVIPPVHEGGTLAEDCSAATSAHTQANSAGNHQSTHGRNAEDELQYMDNYFDHYSQRIRHDTPVQPGSAVERGKSRRSAVGDKTNTAGETTSSPSACVNQVTRGASAGSNKVEGRSPGNNDAGGEVVGDNGSTMTQNRRKPRSRLKKFFSSLLSLSSSSSSSSHDDENQCGDTSSESSSW